MTQLIDLEKKYCICLPAVYVDWFESGGPESAWLSGSDVDFPRLAELQGWAQEILAEDGAEFVLPNDSFVFCMHQGYQFMYFICDGNQNPAVWYYHEGDTVPKIKWNSFSEYLQNT